MTALPSVHYRKVVKALEALGWKKLRQKGSHIIMVKDGHDATLSVPAHNPVAKGTLRSLLRNASLTVDDFVKKL